MITDKRCYLGIDFGTSNTTIGCYKDGKNFLIPLEYEKSVMPSAIFFDFEDNQRLFGSEAINAYLSGAQGRLMRALKSILGTSLVEESTWVGESNIQFNEIIGSFFEQLKIKMENFIQGPVEDIVLGRPVHFVDEDDNKDLKAQQQLEAIARLQGFKNIEFQYEPLAAALDYKQTITKEELVLIIDIGGGTSDFSIIKLSPVSQTDYYQDEILANKGIHLGGGDFDKNFSFLNIMPYLGRNTTLKPKNLYTPNYLFYDLATWHKINLLYNKKTEKLVEEIYKNSNTPDITKRLVKIIYQQKGHDLAFKVEQAKIDLTTKDNTLLDLAFLETQCSINLDLQQLNQSIDQMVEKIFLKIEHTIQDAQVFTDHISTIFLTGGTTALSLINEKIIAKFPNSRIIKGDIFGSVGLGLAIEARRKFS